MKTISRRQVLYGIIAIVVAAKLNAYPRLLKGKEVFNSKAQSEIMEVRRQWKANEPLSPSAYLASRGIDLKDKVTIVDMSRSDFREGNLFEVKGVVLAKTEAAVISVLAEQLSLAI